MLARSLRDFLSGSNKTNKENRLMVNSLEIKSIIKNYYLRKMSRKTIIVYHKVLAGLFLSEADPNPFCAWKSNALEAIKSVPYHLMTAYCLPELAQVLCSLPFLMSTIKNGNGSGLYEDVCRFFLEAQNDSTLSAFTSDPKILEYMVFMKRNLYIPGMCYPLLIQQALCEPQHTFVFRDALSLSRGFNVFLPTENLDLGSCQRNITGFTSTMLCIASNVQRQQIALGCSDGSCLLLDESTGKLLHSFMGHSQSVCAVCFVGPDLVCTGSLDGTLSLWNTQTGSRVSVLTGHSRRVSCCCSEITGKSVISGGWDHHIRIWNVSNGLEVSSRDNKCPVNCVVHHPLKMLVASGDWKGKVKLWDLQTVTQKSILHGHVSSVTCLVFNEAGVLLASGSLNGEIIIWSLISGTQIAKPCKHPFSVQDLVFNGSNLLSAATDGTLKVWASHWNIAKWTRSVFSGKVCIVQMLLNSLIVVGCDQGTLLVFTTLGDLIFTEDLGESISCISQFKPAPSHQVEGILVGTHSGCVKFSGMVEKNSFLPFVNIYSHYHPISTLKSWNGFVFAGYESGHLSVTCFQTSGSIFSDLFEVHESSVTSITVFNHKRILTTSKDKAVKLWHLNSRLRKFHFIKSFENCHSDWIMCSAYSPDSHLLVTGSYDGTLKIWNMATEKTEHVLEGLKEPVSTVNIFDDRVLCTGLYGSLGVWSTTGSLLVIVPSPYKEPIVFSCEFRRDVRQEKRDKTLNVSGLMVTADENKTISLRELFTLSLKKQFVGHMGPVLSCSSPMNQRIVSTSLDGSLRWWTLEDTTSSDAISSVTDVHTGSKITAVDISANSRRCLSADTSGTVTLWNIQENAISYLCHIKHTHAYISKAIFVNDTGTALVYSMKTSDEGKLVYCMEENGILKIEKESELLHEVTCMEYSSKYSSFICGDRSGSLRLDTWNKSSSFKLARDWILEAKFHPQNIEHFYLALVFGSVHVTGTAYANQVSGNAIAPLSPSSNCFITALDVTALDNGEVYAGLADGFLRVATKTGETKIQAHQCAVTSVKVNGRELFTSSTDGTIKVWKRSDLLQIGEFRSRTPVAAMCVSSARQDTKRVLYGTSAGNVHLLIWTPKHK